ncbi:hydroxyisourate hydrolase [Dictyobacter aurantiacus]|uniref:5-hydroxyisourate hydrolase n=1 Tax=Dictyobacter aurantiacus TaxID=1936993 RepID=A0A401ZSC3_9CHLR|nr:hydroxyisourate hydrolase [Dictyobacter aurantiacus]GCE09680.1 5-hydroxyisourate hydrolase [Dictyobacter aurantiacus]
MPGRLTTHVLDTTQGRPAADVPLQLWLLGGEGARRTLLKALHTNQDGRTSEPLLQGHELVLGRYELVFAVGKYFVAQGLALADPPFLDEVPIRFGIARVEEHYHVPLLISPWAYSTYRGS